jgi:malate synthase
MFEIGYYHDYISPELAASLMKQAVPVKGVPGLSEVGTGGGLESREALQFLTALYEALKVQLNSVLEQRRMDRRFIDERVRACSVFNQELKREITDPDYRTIIGLEDNQGRTVIGPLTKNYARKHGKPIAPIPDFLQGPHVTLFGPPDSAKMAINAMNSYHRKIAGEPAVVAELLNSSTDVPKWGADDEDSKTPLRADLIGAGVNLTACFDRTLKAENGKKYELANDKLALPIKRFPGLALPCTFLFLNGNPIPLHLYDFGLHLFRNRHNPRALVFYVPKLENEEEAAYIHAMVATAEKMIKGLHPEYKEGSVRLMIVLENPRAILRAHEIMDRLYPYFAGASLGWHDYLASTARLFKEDRHYRIPVKSDPDIVIKYIKASHLLLAEAVGSRGGIKVGGMYGILPLNNEITGPSFQMTLKGFIKDVIVQMKRDLTGFWVAHPDFVRLGIAMVEGWKLYQSGKKKPLTDLVKALLDKKHHKEILDYIAGKDIKGLDSGNPGYVRSLIVADIKESDFIPNNHPDEIRYNVFQSLQYLADWLAGNGCVALPAIVKGVPVRVMDDLATAERSRWEVWHELRHGRFAMDKFLQIVHEEMHFIRKDLSTKSKIVQVKYDEKSAQWYPIALHLMLQLMTAEEPPEFATELLMPFTIESIRNAADPWSAARAADPRKFKLPAYVERFNYYFEACGCLKFAQQMAANPALDLKQAETAIRAFTLKEIKEAAAFHGDIGESGKTLDANAKAEQARVLSEGERNKSDLAALCGRYKAKFGVKFLISAKDKSTEEILEALKVRIKNRAHQERENAANALAEIALKRMGRNKLDGLIEQIETARAAHQVDSASVALINGDSIQELAFGAAPAGAWYQLASLSKPLATTVALEYFRSKGIPLETPVNKLLGKTKSPFRLKCESNPEWADRVSIEHLINHTALNMHYVAGDRADQPQKSVEERLQDVAVIHEPGLKFSYSGGGFLVLEHLFGCLAGPAATLTERGLKSMGIKNVSFRHGQKPKTHYAHGFLDSGGKVSGGRLNFPGFAAGATGTAADVARYLSSLTKAFHDLNGAPGISHGTAVEMLHGVDRGSREFMGASMGLGIFVAEAGANRFAVHQGANEGFRALFIHCFSGPDRGKGFVIFCNADNRGVAFIGKAAQQILQTLGISGIDASRFQALFNFDKLEQEQIVNLGYKQLIFDAFQPALPEAPVRAGKPEALAGYGLVNEAKILAVSNQRFARAENLFSRFEPEFDPTAFGTQGKIMDSWESARHNRSGCDYLECELKQPSVINYVSLSTQFHDGNHPEFVRLLGRKSKDEPWREILPKLELQGHSLMRLKLPQPSSSCSQVRVEIFPDGGLTRLGLFSELPEKSRPQFDGQSRRYPDPIPKVQKPLVIPYAPSPREVQRNRRSCAGKKNLASQAFGAKLLKATNQHYGPAVQILSPFPPLNMFDGLESARSRQAGHFEEVQIKLAQPAPVKRIIFDFTFFVNNNPEFIRVDGLVKGKWMELVAKTPVKAYAGNKIEFVVNGKTKTDKVRVQVFPDGGINRIQIFS